MKKGMIWAGLAAVLAFTLFSSFELKRPCLEKPWGAPDRLEYRNLCYNDIQPLYYTRNLDKKSFPYIEEKSYEYPVLMGLLMWVPSLFVQNHISYFYATMPALVVLAFVAFFALGGAIGPRRELLWFAAGTPMLFYAYLNWDLLAVAFVCLAMWAWKRGRPGWTGSYIGLGIAAKVYPAFLLPSLMIDIWNHKGERRKNELYALIGGAVGSWLAVNLPFVIAEWWKSGAITGWISVFTFHMQRNPDTGTVWYWLLTINRDSYPAFIGLIPVIVSGWVTIWIISRKDLGSERKGLAIAGVVMTAVLFAVRALIQGGTDWGDSYKTWVDHVSETMFLAGAAALWFHQWRARRAPWTTAAAVLALYLSVSKIHSPQHTLWMLPLMVAVSTPRRTMLMYFLADAMIFYRWL